MESSKKNKSILLDWSKEMSFFNEVEEYVESFFNDPTQLILILVISVCSAIFMVWLEGDKKVNPMQGSGFMKGYKKPDIPPKSMKELVSQPPYLSIH